MTSDKQITISYGPVCKWHDSFEDEDGNTCEGYWTDTGDYEYSVHAGKGRSKYGFETYREAYAAALEMADGDPDQIERWIGAQEYDFKTKKEGKDIYAIKSLKEAAKLTEISESKILKSIRTGKPAFKFFGYYFHWLEYYEERKSKDESE